jgi:hypothetical protein
MLGLLVICLGCMPLKSFNKDWDLEDPNAEIPHLPDRRATDEDQEMGSKHGSNSEAVHVENMSKV